MFRNFCSTMDNTDYFEEFKPPSLERECIEQECIFAEIYEIANDEREFKNLKNILYGSEAKSNVENFEKFKSDADAGSPRVGSNTPGSGSGPGHSSDPDPTRDPRDGSGADDTFTPLQHAELFLKLARNPCEYFHENFDKNKNSTKLCHSKNTKICRKIWMGKTCICKDDFTGTYCSEIGLPPHQIHGQGNDTLMNGSGKRNVYWPVMLYIFLVLIYV